MSNLIIHSIDLDHDVVLVQYESDGNLETIALQRGSCDYSNTVVVRDLIRLSLERKERVPFRRFWTMHTDSDHQVNDASAEPSSPPRLAEFLFSWLAPKKTLQEQLGDLQEIFDLNVVRFGKSRAGMLYWTQVLRAVGPGIWRRFKKLGFIGILIDYGRSKLGF